MQTALPGKFLQLSEQFRVLFSHSLISTKIEKSFCKVSYQKIYVNKIKGCIKFAFLFSSLSIMASPGIFFIIYMKGYWIWLSNWWFLDLTMILAFKRIVFNQIDSCCWKWILTKLHLDMVNHFLGLLGNQWHKNNLLQRRLCGFVLLRSSLDS